MAVSNLKNLLNAWADGYPPRGVGQRLLSGGLRGASAIYRAGSAAHSLSYDLGLRGTRRVGCPVVCVGNLSVGGTGKTPLVSWAARHFRDAGRRVAIVSRGYRRWESSGVVLVSDGSKILVSRDRAGDEPFLLAKSLDGVAVAVGAERYEAARLARERCNADVILLDDGFQHRGLARDCDIVLWDALRPPEAAAFLPRGFLREGLGALRRADALIFTRCNLGEVSRSFLHKIKRIAPHLLIFHASLTSGEPHPLSFQDGAGIVLSPPRGEPLFKSSGKGSAARAGAFCGLGNPESFWKLLEKTGAHLVWKHAFPDHYRPTADELNALLREAREAGAECVFMTEKDMVNLPESWSPEGIAKGGALPLFVLPAQVEFGEDTARFQSFLDRAAERYG